jgi:anti-sigma factor RsiW
MTVEPEQPELSLEEQLTAYLDGELGAEDARHVEALLASDSKVRRAMQRLDRTWQLLDELDTSGVDDQFTRSTLEMVTTAAGEEAERVQVEAPRRRRRRWLALGGGLLGAAAAGFAAVALLAPDPDRELIDDLPILENLDEYRQVGDLEFLQLLYQEKVFDKKLEPSE